MSLKSGTIIKKPTSALDKKIPTNPKYKHVQTTLDTGLTAKKQADLHDEDPERATPGEIFKRIRAGTLTRLIFEEDEIFDPSLAGMLDSGEKIFDNIKEEDEPMDPVASARYNQLSGNEASSVIESQFDSASSSSSLYTTSTSAPLPTSTDSKFLLLDVRTDDLYNQCHIKYGFNTYLFLFFKYLYYYYIFILNQHDTIL